VEKQKTTCDKSALVELIDLVGVFGGGRPLCTDFIEAAGDSAESLISLVDFGTIVPRDHIWVLDGVQLLAFFLR